MRFKWPLILEEVEISFSTYLEDGGLAAFGRQVATGEQYGCITTNLKQPPAHSSDFREIVLNNWSENEGIETALWNAGIIEGKPIRFIQSGFVKAPVYRLTDRAHTQAKAEIFDDRPYEERAATDVPVLRADQDAADDAPEVAAFITQVQRGRTLLAALSAHVDDHLGVDPDDVNWGHVGDATSLATALDELASRFNLAVNNVDLTSKEKAEYAPAKTNDAVVNIDFGDVDKNALGMGYTAKRLLEVLARTQITGTPEDVKEIAQCVKVLTIDEAHFVFTRDDVASVVDTDRDEGRISDEEHSNWKPEYAQEVLRRVYQRHDVTMGVSFETLSEVVREVIAEKVTNVPNDGVPTP
jgi:hypothetical protein